MKVFNLTDVATPALTQRNLVNQILVVYGKQIAPGLSADFDDKEAAPIVVKEVQHFLKSGALSVDKLPDAYLKAKSVAAAAAAKADVPAHPAAAPASPTVPSPPASDPPATVAETPKAIAADGPTKSVPPKGR